MENQNQDFEEKENQENQEQEQENQEQIQGGKKRTCKKNEKKGGKRKGNEWTRLVTKTYKVNHKKNKEYTFKQAIQDARKLYKKGGNAQQEGQEDKENEESENQQQLLGGKRKSRKTSKKQDKKDKKKQGGVNIFPLNAYCGTRTSGMAQHPRGGLVDCGRNVFETD